MNVPSQYVVNGVWLNKWLNEQKLIAEGKRKKKHTPEQLRKLESINLRYGAAHTEEIWIEHYELAKTYYEENGNLDIPKDYVVDDFRLGLWLKRQKKKYRNGELSAKCIELLADIGIDWNENNSVEQSYEIGFRHLEEFIHVNGIGAVTSTCVSGNGYKLGRWISNCKSRFRKGKLAEEYIIRFRKMGIMLGESDKKDES